MGAEGARHDRRELTEFLNQLALGKPEAAETLMPVVYEELKAIARAHVGNKKLGEGTLQPTALVHEAYLRLFGPGRAAWRDRMHFFAFAAKTMRSVLVDNARRRQRLKSGGGRLTLTLDTAQAGARGPALDLIDLDQALQELGSRDEQQMRIVELRFFGGLEMQDVAEVLALSKSTVEREWRSARAWLGVRLACGE